ncbi:MAG: Hypothetical protein C75L2_00410009 [Leptospirillum sp. Group II 'C75']|uniref:Uncharacterized protein n=1 Tax=Leptospirillum sp. Group II '5-way CG' TaxID=419541 RepID=B6ARV2_9BACT|nr:MAG: hypothetical protein UBAL2_80490239a [Leptospirillum rubarum]EDZ38198.1 MAG: Hypothetical protein CGL2_11284018 [Leptospirillum sp. Group II '5-way CG']EIJ75578.1 MAG: Hypothetical protein C75L2_00410009 [Leptospirillum sp. Group II 'C75']
MRSKSICINSSKFFQLDVLKKDQKIVLTNPSTSPEQSRRERDNRCSLPNPVSRRSDAERLATLRPVHLNMLRKSPESSTPTAAGS